MDGKILNENHEQWAFTVLNMKQSWVEILI